MTAGSATATAVRSMDGPFLARRCVRSGAGYRWFEQALAPGAYLDADQLRLLAGVVPEGPARTAVADLVRPDLAAWPVLPSPALLCDPLFGAPADAATAPLEHACAELGAFLGRVHAVPAADVTFLPARGGAAWLPAGSELTGRVGTARVEIDRLGDGVLAAAAATAGAPKRPGALVHGRFSSGLVVPLAQPVLLGWREGGIGDPDRDLAYLLAELVEAAAVGTGAGRFPVLVRRFLTGYAATGGQFTSGRLPALVADRLLEHYAQGVVAVGSAEGLDRVVAAVTERWRELPELIADGGR